eukprot:1146135-Pelagomonas_calceolata.AAC.24
MQMAWPEQHEQRALRRRALQPTCNSPAQSRGSSAEPHFKAAQCHLHSAVAQRICTAHLDSAFAQRIFLSAIPVCHVFVATHAALSLTHVWDDAPGAKGYIT